MIFRIWAPRDVMGSPIIKNIPIDVFINAVARQTASDLIENERIKKLLEKWRGAALLLGIIVAMWIAIRFF